MPPKAPKPLDYNASVIYREDLTDLLAVFRVRADEPAGTDGRYTPEFIAGQYAVLGANNEVHPEKGSVRRAYSIASAPSDRDWLEFYVRLVTEPESENPLTHLLWTMKDGTRLWLGTKITGHFTVHHTVGDEDPRTRICVAAGTGLAPFYSMVRDHVLRGEPDLAKRYVILHGASHPGDLGYRDILQEMLNTDGERYFASVSRPQLHPDWTGDTGRVESFFDEEKLPGLEDRLRVGKGFITPRNSVVYICGLQGTIAQTLIRLLHRGFVPSDKRIRKALGIREDVPASIFYEQYDTTPILDLNDQDLMNRLRALIPDEHVLA